MSWWWPLWSTQGSSADWRGLLVRAVSGIPFEMGIAQGNHPFWAARDGQGPQPVTLEHIEYGLLKQTRIKDVGRVGKSWSCSRARVEVKDARRSDSGSSWKEEAQRRATKLCVVGIVHHVEYKMKYIVPYA
ncbi:hypothetical protein B0H12DRAFT_520487 [Mycena haematopus]|nr:hypothetical protein B0H12DRAFT_520487 [Mycena haematopus]